MKELKKDSGYKSRKSTSKKSKNVLAKSTLKKPLIMKPDDGSKNNAILYERAISLAVAPKEESIYQHLIEIIVFSLASETYAIETNFVREVYPLKKYTVIPGTPSFVLGVINIRGQIVSVIDLKKFFGLPEKGIGELNKVIIIENQLMEFGILADNIQGTQTIPLPHIQSNISNMSEIGSEYIKGVTKENLIVLDAKKILEDETILVDKTK